MANHPDAAEQEVIQQQASSAEHEPPQVQQLLNVELKVRSEIGKLLFLYILAQIRILIRFFEITIKVSILFLNKYLALADERVPEDDEER